MIDRILLDRIHRVKFDNLTITIIALLFIIVASLSTNLVSNFIPSQYSLINFIPNKLNLKSSSLIIGFLGFVVSIFWLTIISQIGILSFIDTFAAFFGPLFGVMIADYYLIKNKELSNNDIYSIDGEGLYFYSGGWHLKGVYSLFIGFIFYLSGVDVLENDKLGRLSLTINGCKERDRFILEICKNNVYIYIHEYIYIYTYTYTYIQIHRHI